MTREMTAEEADDFISEHGWRTDPVLEWIRADEDRQEVEAEHGRAS